MITAWREWSQCFLLEFHPLGSWWFNVFRTIVLLNVTKKLDCKDILNWWTMLFWCRNGSNGLWFLPSPAEVSSWSQTYWMLMLPHSQLCVRRFLLSLPPCLILYLVSLVISSKASHAVLSIFSKKIFFMLYKFFPTEGTNFCRLWVVICVTHWFSCS